MIDQIQVDGGADFCDSLMSSPSPIFYDCDCINICLRATGECQAEILALLSSGSFAINPNGFILMKLSILISSTQICQVELPLAGDPLLSSGLLNKHWVMLDRQQRAVGSDPVCLCLYPGSVQRAWKLGILSFVGYLGLILQSCTVPFVSNYLHCIK